MVAQLVSFNQAQSEDNQIEIIRQFLNYPIKQRDSFGARFWLLRPGKNEEEARETCPIAVSFSSELERKTDKELRQFLTSDEQDKEIRGHYTKRTGEDQPVMYLLLPTNTSQGRVAFLLPTEGKLRQRSIQTFTWDDKELTARFERLKQESLETADKIVEKALNFVPQVDWIFYKSVRTAKELAQELAQVTLRLEQAIPRIYKNEGKDGYLHKLFKSFQDELLPNLQLASDNAKDYSFADIYAQTISYGLFTARVFGYQNDILTDQPTSNYFEVDGKPLNERKHWLNDDYVKFIRFGQWRIEKTGYGVLTFVTNHGYLDNPTFRGMRQSLMKTFDDIYVLDLHGNSKKKECCADGSKDENVFDIQQGVSICLFVKKLGGNQELANVYHADLYGMRDFKYNWLGQNSITTTQWENLTPQSPFYLFVPQNTDNLSEYEQGWKVTDIFPVNSTGIVTARDSFVIDIEPKLLLQRIKDLINTQLSDQEIRNKYFAGKGSSKYPNGDTRGWKLPEARRKLRADNNWDKRVAQILYRPFDNRSIYYTDSMVDWSRREVMQHMLAGENLGLITARSNKSEEMNHFFCSSSITETKCGESTTQSCLIPLYLYPKAMGMKKRPNLSQEFLNAITEKLGYTPTPEAIFYYIYAIFHSPTYRTRYAEFLKIDFPRVPLTSNDKLFRQLAEYGEQLVQLHLMTSPKLDNFITEFVEEKGNCTVDPGHPKYDRGAVIINKKATNSPEFPKKFGTFILVAINPAKNGSKTAKVAASAMKISCTIKK
jgi:hypothetical protein